MTQTSNTVPTDIHGKPYNRKAMIGLILIATFAGVLMQTSLGTAVPTLMRAFDINLSTAQQATTWFLLANGVMIPVSAYLTTKFSTKKLYIFAFSLMWVGMAVTAFTPEHHDMWNIFLVGRVLAALAVGITMPLMQVVMVNVYSARDRGAAMGMSGLVVGMAPAIGPTLSGWILEKPHEILGLTLPDSWRTIFFLPMAILAVVIVLSFFLIKDVIPNRDVRLDVRSLVMSVIGFGSFLWGFTNVGEYGWSDFSKVILPIALGTAVITLFIRRQLMLKDPFMNVRIFKNRQFTLTTIGIMMAMMAMMGVEMMLPTYLQNVHNLSSLDSGLALLPGAIVMGAMSPIAGRMFDRNGIATLAMIGFTILAIGTVPFLWLQADTPTIYIEALYALRMFGIAMVMMPLTASAMSAVPVEESSHATASNNTARQIASAVVVALLTSVMQDTFTKAQPSHHMQQVDPLRYGHEMVEALMTGFHASFALSLLFALIGLAVAFRLAKRQLQSEEEQEA